MEAQIVEVKLDTGSYTNKIKHNVLFSIKQNKFIKGRPHKGLSWGIDYRLLPGYYYKWSVNGLKDERGVEFAITKVYVDDKGSINGAGDICAFNLILTELRSFTKDPEAPESLRLFIESLPSGYHTVGDIPDPSKTFQPDEVKKVCEYLKKKVEESAEY